jgi:hypothetical protein
LLAVKRGEGLSDAVKNALKASGARADRNHMTQAGRAFAKHREGSRTKSNYPKATSMKAKELNKQGQEILDSIIDSTSQRYHENKFGGVDIWDNQTGRGARFDSDDNFIAFLDP